MPLLLVVLFVAVPLVELVVIMQVAGWISTGPTVALLVADSILGAWLLRREGRKAWAQFRDALQEARWPGDEVTQGGLIIVGGTLLLTPGFVTDVVGFLLLLAPTRAAVSKLIRARLTPAPLQAARAAGARRAKRRGPGAGEPKDGDGVLDVEVVEIRREELSPEVGPESPEDEQPT
jgi:UPF0716 protein FxsA